MSNTLINSSEVGDKLNELGPEWKLSDDQKLIIRQFNFKNYFQGIMFVNAVAWVAQEAKHHPDLEVNYGKVVVKFTTHDAGGLTEKDFASAKLVEDLFW